MRRCPPGIAHDLIIALKGFESRDDAAPYLTEIADLNPQPLLFTDAGLDLDVYFAAASRLRSERFCFVNSFSIPLAERWLEKLNDALDEPGTGLVGATGSWASTWSWAAHSLGLPSAYRGVLPPAVEVRGHLIGMRPQQLARGKATKRESLRDRLSTLRLLSRQSTFPAYHVRTNGFMITRATIEQLRLPKVRGLLNTLALENSRIGLTHQVQASGSRTLVVDREGRVFDREQWDQSRTFCQADQEGLLLADNRTRLYEHADTGLKAVLAGLNWGTPVAVRA